MNELISSDFHVRLHLQDIRAWMWRFSAELRRGIKFEMYVHTPLQSTIKSRREI